MSNEEESVINAITEAAANRIIELESELSRVKEERGKLKGDCIMMAETINNKLFEISALQGQVDRLKRDLPF